MNAEPLCVRCARQQDTCCQVSEVYVTPGDVRRIAAATGREDFFEFRGCADPAYLDQDDDPKWADRVFREDGGRRILRRRPGGDCTFLGPAGCTLSLETRPLVCRLYPYQYTERGIDREELATGCPLHLLRPGQGLIVALGMDLERARAWHRRLYAELEEEPVRAVRELAP